MPSMPWVKLWTEILDDVKLAGLTDAQRWRFVQLILLAAECDAAGALVTGESRMTHAQIAWRLRCDEMTLESDIKKLVEVGLLYEDGAIIVTNFATRQGPTQEDKRKQWADRQKKHRERVKNADVTSESRVSHADVTLLEEEEERDKDKELTYIRDVQEIFERLTGYPVMPNPDNLKALQEMERLGVNEEDMADAVAYFSKNSRVAQSPSQLLKSVKLAHAKRVQGKAQPIQTKEPYAAEVYG